ncbi:MAG: membrane autotransporter barrel domain protein, partial [Dongia sp.]
MKVHSSRALRRCMSSAFVLSLMLAGSTAFSAEMQSVNFDGATFVNKGLVAVGRVPSDAKDKLGDTLGGIGSGMVADLGSWKKDGDTYTGTLYMLPDRGWNTEGSVDYPGRLQKFSIALTPVDGSVSVPAGADQQAQLKLTYDDSILMHEANGTPSTGLDPTDVRAAADGMPDLP